MLSKLRRCKNSGGKRSQSRLKYHSFLANARGRPLRVELLNQSQQHVESVERARGSLSPSDTSSVRACMDAHMKTCHAHETRASPGHLDSTLEGHIRNVRVHTGDRRGRKRDGRARVTHQGVAGDLAAKLCLSGLDHRICAKLCVLSRLMLEAAWPQRYEFPLMIA